MIIPYLAFRGDCEEALTFYTNLFGGEIVMLSRFTRDTGPASLVGKVMHAEVKIGDHFIAGGDGGDPTGSFSGQDAISLMIHCATKAKAQEYFDALAQEGQALQPLTPHPPPDDGGMGALVLDRYGFKWILTAPNDTK